MMLVSTFLRRRVRLFMIHVDDFAIFNNDQKVCDRVYANLNRHFTLKKGDLHHFLGMRVTRNESDMTISLDQEEYTESVLERFEMQDCKPVVCPEEQVAAIAHEQ